MVSSPVSHRRALHQIPELSFELPKTVAYVRTALESLNCTLSAPIPGSVCAAAACASIASTSRIRAAALIFRMFILSFLSSAFESVRIT